MSLNFRAALAGALLTLTLPLLNGCGIDNVDDGHVRIVNATAGYPSIDLYTVDSNGDDSLLVSGTAAGSASAYEDVKKGSINFAIKSGSTAGTASNATGTITTNDHFTLVSFATGNALQTTILSDDENAPGSGNAKLRVLNGASSEAGSVDVYLSQSDCNALSTTDTAFVSDVGAPTANAAFTGAYSQVTASASGTTWHLCVTSAGDPSTVLVDNPSFTLKDQEIATLILTRTTGGVLLNAALLDQQGGLNSFSNSIARVRVVADAASGAAVSATVNGVALATATTSPTITGYATVPAGAITGSFSIGGVAINGASLPALTAGSDYTVFVGGTVSVPTITLITDDNSPSTSSSAPVSVRVLNGVNGINGTMSATVGNKSFNGIAFGTASTYGTTAAAAGTGALTLTVPGASLSPPNTQTYTSGEVYTVLVYGDVSNPTYVVNPDR